MQKQFTASTYIFHQQKVLLIFHEKFQKWLPPGGHVEANETPDAAAKREVKEETGLEIQFFTQENLQIRYLHANSIPRPFLCCLEDVPAYKEQPAHQHIDFIYVAQPLLPLNPLPPNCSWFDINAVKKLLPSKDIFPDSLDIIHHLFHSPVIQN